MVAEIDDSPAPVMSPGPVRVLDVETEPDLRTVGVLWRRRECRNGGPHRSCGWFDGGSSRLKMRGELVVALAVPRARYADDIFASDRRGRPDH